MAASGDRQAGRLRTAEWEHVQASADRVRQQLREQLELGPAHDKDRLAELAAELTRLGHIQARLIDEYNAGQGAAGALRELWGDLKQFAQEAGDCVCKMSVAHWLDFPAGNAAPRQALEKPAGKKAA